MEGDCNEEDIASVRAVTTPTKLVIADVAI